MRTILVSLSICFLLFTSLTGCSYVTDIFISELISEFVSDPVVEHTFIQSRENVVKVEISTCSNLKVWGRGEKVETIHPVVELSKEEIDSLWNELLDVEAMELRYVNFGCGDIVFVFTYADGQQELIGYSEIAVLNADGTFDEYRGHYMNDYERMTELFAKYADPEMLCKESDYFRSHYE